MTPESPIAISRHLPQSAHIGLLLQPLHHASGRLAPLRLVEHLLEKRNMPLLPVAHLLKSVWQLLDALVLPDIVIN